MRSRVDTLGDVPGLRVIERIEEPTLTERLHARETPTVVHVDAGRVVAAAVGARACRRLLKSVLPTLQNQRAE